MDVDSPQLVVSLPEKTHASPADYDNVWTVADDVSRLYAQVNKSGRQSPAQELQRPLRKLIISRHGERCDFAFYKTWFEKSFDSEGNSRIQVELNVYSNLLRDYCF